MRFPHSNFPKATALLVALVWFTFIFVSEGMGQDFEPGQTWNRNPNPNPQYNFSLFGQGEPAGNINGDSLNGHPVADFIVTGMARDERTSSVLEDSVYKTAVFYGGNTSGEPDDVIYRKLVPVGDLNGDGFSDAIAVDTSYNQSSYNIYKGSAAGYENTNNSLPAFNKNDYRILGFNNVNADSINGNPVQDIFLYSISGDSVKIAMGLSNFTDITFSSYSGVLPFMSKRVVVKDVDNDDVQEIITFAGIYGDGQIYIQEINSDLTISQENYSPLTFSSFSGLAEDHALHVIDVTGDGYDDIVISKDRQTATYIFQYNNSDGLYLNSFSELSPTQLIPVGDLDNDSAHDFIQGDSTQAYISYSNSDLTQPAKDVALEGASSTEWIWQMTYNPYGEFGDFNGDGIDDVLLSHFEGTISNKMLGRRILFGGASELDYNSLFHQYPYENFYSQVSDVLEIGDINDDGLDDFAMVMPQLNRVEIYQGANTISQAPAYAINLSFNAREVATGDYTGDGKNDIVISGLNDTNPLIALYTLGNSAATNKTTLNASDWQSNSINMDLSGIHTIGDINGDGSEEFLVGSGEATTDIDNNYLNEGYIFYGGSTISTTPDDFIYFGGEGTTNIERVAASAAPLNDVNGDGLNDFVAGAPDKLVGDRRGQVRVFLSDRTDSTLTPDGFPAYYGYSIATGDFNGNGAADVAVSSASSYSDPPANVNIFYGENFDGSVDQQLPLSDFDTQSRYAKQNFGKLKTIPDYNNDGRDELILGSTGIVNNHAALFTFSDTGVAFIRGANEAAGLGSTNYLLAANGSMAVGNFRNGDELDAILTQFNDNNDAYRSSRVYRYFLGNISPPTVEGIELTTTDATKSLSWLPVSTGDLKDYIIYRLESINGSNVWAPIDTTKSETVSLSNNFEGVQSFRARARDLYDNIGPASMSVGALYPKVEGYNFNAGWNLIGLPVDAAPDSIQGKIMNTASSRIFEYAGGYTDVSKIEAGKGYWVKFDKEAASSLEGLPFAELNLNLNEGWNLISGIGGELPLESVQDPDGIILPGTLYEFRQSYIKSDTLRPASGYWIRATADGTVTFTHPKLQSNRSGTKASKSNNKPEEKFARIIVSDGSNEQILFFGATLPEQVDKRNYSMPPLPPGDSFDARFDGNLRLTEKINAEIHLKNGNKGPVNININAENLLEQSRFIIQEYAEGKLLSEYNVTSGDEVTLKHNETSLITLKPAGDLPLSETDNPDEFKLKQNYPNPFNPTTQIEYAITERSTVTLEVFNILGRKVKTLINGEQSAGSYIVNFDGSNLASGVYLYRLRAGDKVSTKKFILVK